MRRFVGAMALLPLLVVAVAAPILAMRCRTTGTLMALCACPASGDASQAPATVGAQTCCELHKVDAVRPVSEPPTTRAFDAEDAVAAQVPVVLELPAPRPPIVALARPAAHGRPPLLLAKSVLLI